MSSGREQSMAPLERAPLVDETVGRRLEAYYVRYYRDTLGIPEWRELVTGRLDEAPDRRRLARLEAVLEARIGGRRLLNVGCGTGGFNRIAERAGGETWGVDTSEEAIGIAIAHAPTARFVRAGAESLPFPDRTFDVVYCVSALEHFSSADRAVAEMYRVLRDGGALYVHTPHRLGWYESHYKVFWVPGLPRGVARAYLRVRRRPPGFLDSLRLRTRTECAALLAAVGARVRWLDDPRTYRPVAGPLWPLVRLYYRISGIRPYIEFVATRGDGR